MSIVNSIMVIGILGKMASESSLCKSNIFIFNILANLRLNSSTL